ncbi:MULTISPECIES: cytochrome o ubiquinol/quinol oxidase subunit IV [unclassified Brevibacillus]|uniref:cytochrome o ubiquinol oxidase subunit IV n=1 Tax=unclassified Brevibacillus TaxID=2684853 RepID=UPI00356A25C2
MNKQSVHGTTEQHGGHGSLKSYVISFVLSLVFTIIPILALENGWLDSDKRLIIYLGAALFQFIVQLFFFMHLKEEDKPRYNLMSLLLGLFIVFLIVIGSIWIMMYNMVAL